MLEAEERIRQARLRTARVRTRTQMQRRARAGAEKKKTTEMAVQGYITAAAVFSAIMLSLSGASFAADALSTLKSAIGRQYPPGQAYEAGREIVASLYSAAVDYVTDDGTNKSAPQNSQQVFSPDNSAAADRLTMDNNWEDSGKNPPPSSAPP